MAIGIFKEWLVKYFFVHKIVLKDVFKESEGNSHKTAQGKKITAHTSKAPGFGPKGIVDHVLPIACLLSLGVQPSQH
jgi:hypothetical protein